MNESFQFEYFKNKLCKGSSSIFAYKFFKNSQIDIPRFTRVVYPKFIPRTFSFNSNHGLKVTRSII